MCMFKVSNNTDIEIKLSCVSIYYSGLSLK